MDAEMFDTTIDKEEIPEEIKSMDEKDINIELKLPVELLPTISLKEKRFLLHKKSSMTEIEWEQELDRRMEKVQKSIDLTRLISMQSSTVKGGKAGKGKKATVKTNNRSRRRKFSAIHDDDDDEEEDEEEEEEESEEEEEEREDEVEEGEEMDKRSDGSDDLFDSDEEEYISRKFEGTKASKKTKLVPTKAKKSRLSAAAAAASDDDDS